MLDKLFFKEAIVVEGKYDKIKLSGFIGSTIICTDGFRIFKDKKKSCMIKTIAENSGIIIATDSDVAGFKIRAFLKSITKNANIKNVYIPQIKGKESRKTTPSKENTLGVEGINIDVLKNLFSVATQTGNKEEQSKQITKLDFVIDGLSGAKNSKDMRSHLLEKLNLPPYLSANALLDVINRLMSYDEYKKFIEKENN
ncbi:MAG: DUF4093 domain-containing protein [Oscillospiraceae bacterium]